VDVFVVGSALFGSRDYAATVADLRRIADEAHAFAPRPATWKA
jgi:pentose-5-phosphate-3-epimerase